MKTIILALRLSVLFCFLFTLTACGGGGGGGGGSKDSPPATVTPSDSDGDGVDDPQDKFPKDPSESVDTDADGIGNNADTDDDNDNYSDNLDAFPLDKNRWNRLAVSLNSLDLSVTFGSSYSLAGERLAIAGDNAPWRAHSSQSWLTLSQSSGMGPANIGISCNGSELTPGIHTANVTFVDTDTQDQQVVTISVNVALPALQISNFGGDNGVIFNVSNGWEFFSGERIWINLDTGEAQYPTSINLNFPLANAITTDLSQTSLSNSGQFLQLGVDRSHVRAGKYEGSLTITANVKGRLVSRTLPVSLTASEHILYTSDDGIAFTSLPSLHKLSQVITIKDSYELTDTRWTATTSQPWLTATPSGTTATDLIIHADPAGLAQNKLHIATVDIAPDDPNIENNMQIQVGLWVGNTEPNEIHRLSANYVQVAADPVRPYVYAHDGNSTIRIFNIFNYSQVGTITNVGSELGEMKVSGDGTYLVVYDTHAENLVRINLNTPASRLKIPLPVYSTAFAMARPLG
ncbi:MAG TPA: BACON domain-containing carbohydrate-binding protein, partial [Dongiaceae bacterium]|nr:BACON domain-containing carbohydrate-binding protein [Dongiaceae bacterium]